MKKIGLLGGLNQSLMMAYYEGLNQRVLEGSHQRASLNAVMVTWNQELFSTQLKDRNKVRLIKELIYACDQLKQMGVQVIAFTDSEINRYIPEIKKHLAINILSKEAVLGNAMVESNINKVLLISDFDQAVDPYYIEAYSRYGVSLIVPPLKWVNKIRLDQKKITNQNLSLEAFQMNLIGLIESYALKGITGVILEGQFLEKIIDPSLLSVHVFKSTTLHLEALYKHLNPKL